MREGPDEREIKYLGQEALIVLQNAALIRVTEQMSQDAIDELVLCNPGNLQEVMTAQTKVKVVAEIVERLETMAGRANALIQEETEEAETRSTLN
jgi:hypothetical protein